jgi:trigger factor
MNITSENTGELTATVKVEVSKQDYEEKVNKILKDYQHKANIPGFRPGKVPIGLIKKMYGKAVIADEINTLLSESLASYLKEEKLEILGNPLPNKEKNADINFDLQDSFDFYFDLGLAPKIDNPLSDKLTIDRYVIKVDDTMLDGYIENTRKRFGTSIKPEVSAFDDMLTCDLAEIDENGNLIESGIKKDVFIDLNLLKKEESKIALTGLSKDSKLRIRPLEFFSDVDEAAKSLSLAKEKVEQDSVLFEITVREIHRLQPASQDKELFDKVYAGKNIETEEQFRDEVRKDASNSFVGETDKLFYNQATKKLVDEAQLKLPDEFLKRWLLENRETKITAEDISDEYAAFADSTRWQMIENKILMDNNITVSEDEVRAYIKAYFLSQIQTHEDNPEMDKKYDSVVDALMENKEQVRKIYNELYYGRLLTLFKDTFTIANKEISYEEFINLASANHGLGHIHDHEHEHDHGHDHDHDHDHDHEHEHEHQHNH